MQLFNSLTEKKEQFKPIDKNRVTLYVCGITPYDTTHLGHAFTYVSFDLLVRYLKYKGYNVTYTQNVTDINDRDNDILKKAKEQNIPWQELATYWTKRFLDDMEKLNWIKPTNYLKASQQIGPMITLIQRILKKNIAYQVSGGVYLDISKISDYGKLSKLTREQMFQLAKDFEEDIENPNKKHQLDITLWRPTDKHQPAHIPSFESPFGLGRPGWHLECSAMAISSLSEHIDIHGGGMDLKFPHHEDEIAQSESATGKIPFAHFWLHTGTVKYKGEKMSKSLGNLVMTADLLKKYSPNAIRYVLLSHHYRDSWEFVEKELVTAEEKIALFKKTLTGVSGNASLRNKPNLRELESIFDDDLNSPKVLRYFETTAKYIIQNASKNMDTKKNALLALLSLFGFSI